MAPKIQKVTIFTETFWDRPISQTHGDQDSKEIWEAVGYALTAWERTDQALASIFAAVTSIINTPSSNAVMRAYGSIESNSGRRNAIFAAAEIYFGNHWSNKAVRQKLTDHINAVMWGAKRRDDIAHGSVGSYQVDGADHGNFLTPPDYNTGRNAARAPLGDDPLGFLRAKYRYTRTDILSLANKFDQLEDALRALYISLMKVDGVIPLVRDLPTTPEEKTSR